MDGDALRNIIPFNTYTWLYLGFKVFSSEFILMELIKNLKELTMGDWVKVYSKDISQSHFKIGKITHKLQEKDKPFFELKIFRTNLPLSTEQLLQKLGEKMWGNKVNPPYTQSKCNEKDRIFRLDKKQKLLH